MPRKGCAIPTSQRGRNDSFISVGSAPFKVITNKEIEVEPPSQASCDHPPHGNERNDVGFECSGVKEPYRTLIFRDDSGL